jgi:hypothetical protein
MKKFIFSLIFVLISFVCFSQKKGDSILKPGYEMCAPLKGMLVGIKHENTGNRIGFATYYGAIILEPQFDDLYEDFGKLGSLVPVKKNGKWGLVDMDMKNGKPLVMPCEYYSKDAVLDAYKKEKR